jgi:hypothetical protein
LVFDKCPVWVKRSVGASSLFLHYRWGLIDVRYASIATKFRIAPKWRGAHNRKFRVVGLDLVLSSIYDCGRAGRIPWNWIAV